MTEIRRVRDVEVPPAYHTTCDGCGREITLFWNGGELDSEECCGLVYSLEAPTIDFVVVSREDRS